MVLVGVAGCGGTDTDEAEAMAQRAREVASAWDGSPAAAAWREGYHPLAEAVELPRGGWRSRRDAQAYAERALVLRGTLPVVRREEGRVVWAAGKGETVRPMRDARETYKALSGGTMTGRPQLNVTGVRLGEMTVTTSRGAAVVPAWLFQLEGYATPLKRAAVVASDLPRSPIAEAENVPGNSLQRVITVDPDGRSLTVEALHGACDGGPAVAVLETRGSVVLSASVRPGKGDRLCTKQGNLKKATVRLKRAIGDRVLLDGKTGRPVGAAT
ncbi:hypothetical protein GCM10010329_44700 [Streptomyces spiroverticillatus]|uniref:Uncharacterized protein n=2 Tax=Streptomyces finlayi TaxID=67296 RepID=A0A919CBC6_9ACTN|nr:hypothetical protein GCM10010329_44700 [Streptomyces spiroverticillatus]GHC98928.1 hypothetical protein GCM10010334_41880 [Streptomyces finlayi]